MLSIRNGWRRAKAVKIEFLESGAEECPLIRIYGNEPVVCQRLKRAFEELAQDSGNEVSLTDLPGVQSIDGCCLIAQAGRRDQGVVRQDRTVFRWILTPGGWDNVSALIDPFCHGPAGGYQWLDQVPASDARVLLSSSGEW
jgi:hypothetical protein